MKLMVSIFFVVTAIIVDQTHFRGQYMDQVARAIASMIN
jgi:allantoicase